MANLMNQVKLSVKPSRNGFDLSFKNNFTAKAGELRPCFLKAVLPGDKWNINLKSFTRLQPVNTAAFARMREYYNFYFVPMELLWNKFDSVITQMKSNLQHANGPLLSDNVAPDGTLPYVTCEQLAKYISAVKSNGKLNTNFFGYDRATLTCILLEYLGYGNFYRYLEDGVTWQTYPMYNNLRLSIFPLLAYQHVYADYYRYTQWERTNPSTFNCDYIKGNGDLNVDILNEDFLKNYNFLDMRYCNFNKDMFFGVLPNAQFGEESSISVDIPSHSVFPFRAIKTSDSSFATGALKSTLGVIQADTDTINFRTLSDMNIGNISILALRQAEALQRWKEVAQSVDEDYKAQIQAQWGVTVSDFLSHQSRYIGGTASSLDINPVVNQNITGDNGAEIAGIGTVVNNGSINFESKGEYGFIIGLYHAVPIFDYQCGGVNPDVSLTDALDFPIPAFDRIGMEQVPNWYFTNPLLRADVSSISDEEKLIKLFLEVNEYLGYAPRYVSWKTSVDVSRGAFTSSLKNWVVPYDLDLLYSSIFDAISGGADRDDSEINNSNITYKSQAQVMWSFFKCNPAVLDTLFAVAADSTVDTDHFLISSFFDAKVARNLDVNGLPY